MNKNILNNALSARMRQLTTSSKMMGYSNFFLYVFLVFNALYLQTHAIDVVIPCHNKDADNLSLCIAGIRNNVRDVRRIIVVSDTKFTNHAEWFPEHNYPFSFQEVKKQLRQVTSGATTKLYHVGWYLQQLLKLYAPFVIPNISENVLVIDADTTFLKPVTFIDEDGYALYSVGSEYHKPYFYHAQRMLPSLKKVFPEYSGICHHMLFQREPLLQLFNEVEEFHRKPFWKIFCRMVDETMINGSGASEYEIYFNYVFSHDYKIKIRKLRWCNAQRIGPEMRDEGYDYVSCHKYL